MRTAAADPTVRRVRLWEQAQHNSGAQSLIAAAVRPVVRPPATASSSFRAGSRIEARAQSANDDARPLQTNAPDDSSAPSTAIDGTGDLLRTTPELPTIRSIEEEAATPVLLPSLYDERGRLMVPPPLYGSREVLLRQNRMADRDGLSRVQNDAGLLDLRREKKLVPLPVDETLRVDYRLPANRRFSRPWTAQFLIVLARDHYASFHSPLQVDSAVRTVQFQQRLLRTNGNAAPAAGETASPHLTGQAVDIAKSSLSLAEIAWMRAYLEPLIQQGKIDVEEEFQQACFHISVYKNYLPPISPHATAAVRRIEIGSDN